MPAVSRIDLFRAVGANSIIALRRRLLNDGRFVFPAGDRYLNRTPTRTPVGPLVVLSGVLPVE